MSQARRNLEREKRKRIEKLRKIRELDIRHFYVLTRPGGEKLRPSEAIKQAKLLLSKKLKPEDFISARNLRLKIELVPSPLWKKSLRNTFPKTAWETIRGIEMKRANGKCEICGRPGVECHEKWIYDDQDHKQKLTGFEIVCKDCHLVHHYGRAVMQGLGEKARVHFERVNGLGDQEALREIRLALALYWLRSEADWTQDLSFLHEYSEAHNLRSLTPA